MTWQHASGDDSDGCIPCWEEAAFEAFPAIPEGPWCREPSPDEEGRCKTCSHFVTEAEPVLALPAEACE